MRERPPRERLARDAGGLPVHARPRARRLRGADGDALLRRARPDDRRHGAAADRRRHRRADELLLDRHRLHARPDGDGARVRQARRRPRAARLPFLVAIGLFLVGSALCGLARTMPQLVAFRALQGIGAGGIFPIALSTVGGLVPPRERGRYQGLIGATFAGAAIGGPPLGGVIVDNASWRWIFYVNLPIGVLAFAGDRADAAARARAARAVVDWLGRPCSAPGPRAPARAGLGRPPVRVDVGRGGRRLRRRGGAARRVRARRAARPRDDPPVRDPPRPDGGGRHALPLR